MNDLYKKNCAVLAQWYAGECKEELQIDKGHGWRRVNTSDNLFSVTIDHPLRLKPHTILVNAIEVPEPIRELPEKGAQVWVADIANIHGAYVTSYVGNTLQIMLLQHGLLHYSKEAATDHINAIIATSKAQK